ncbi:hypothetical protein [Streptomyces sp. IBSBF 3136]|uniref:hypothetical protein n=1 Tax=Streptomyces sp. IBSBF 3136 TaxID=2903524 RepID=UPI002FDC53AE
MSIYELLSSGASAALVLASTVAGTYVLLVLIVLISPSSLRGKAARDLLALSPLSKKDQEQKNSGD